MSFLDELKNISFEDSMTAKPAKPAKDDFYFRTIRDFRKDAQTEKQVNPHSQANSPEFPGDKRHVGCPAYPHSGLLAGCTTEWCRKAQETAIDNMCDRINCEWLKKTH
jgi:hypothetical protein